MSADELTQMFANLEGVDPNSPEIQEIIKKAGDKKGQ